ncbi:ribose transport system permease protein [Lachnospiraceae bacterium PF1-21]|uniref:ABC transporter permease n=1 Tax=Ohessyouella blattaphilus TaxID=2949333 RepID=A0ABT1EJD3_9FIRM|nr:ABC transporter permease [Ohessyouella blattaphilus]MCP1110798.1 ABC transporter permease [Ohessyouella blattaphilus]MCR8564192.1 ABC transporter permease [Ohessyouella blattaphilus]MDL2250052.1 ABC transporter permease [Lachnospiraceae bacterium OttesenSCG-928-J05]
MSSNKVNIKSNSRTVALVKSNMGILLVMLLIGVVLTFLTPNFLTSSNIISVLRQISNNIFLAIGMTLVIILGGIDLSVGSIVAMSGTLTVGFIVTNHIPIGLAIIIGLLLGTLVGLFNGVIISVFKVPAFIVTLATMNIAKGVAYIYSGGRSTRITSEVYSMLGTGYLFGIIPLPVVYMIALIIIFSIILNKTKFGTYVYAVGGNRESARLSGVPIKKVEMLVFTISGFLAAFAGIILSSRMYSGQPKAGDGYEMDAIAACVLGGISMSGGTGSLSGTVIGAIVIGIISNGLNLIGVSSFWQLLVKGLIILIAIIIDSQKARISDTFAKRKKN